MFTNPMFTPLQFVPPWVYAILALLLALGWLQSRTRQVAPRALIALAAGMTAYSLYGVLSAFGASLWPLLLWLAGMTAAVTVAAPLLVPRGLQRLGTGRNAASRVLLPGSWLPLGLMMGIFAGKFALGMARGLGSPVVGQLWFVGGLSLLFGLLSGGFAARARAVWRVATKA